MKWDMGLECDVCKVWAHTKCEKITIDEYKVFEKKHSPSIWICKECKEIDFVAKFERVENANGQEGNKGDERPVDRKSREEHGRESKGDGKECGGTSKRNDDGNTPESGGGSK